jgi:outer membrane receptor for ferric coprogen and ferric-rhodotorulic acid
MRIDVVGNASAAKGVAAFDFEESYRLRNSAAAEDRDAALQKVEEAQESNTKTTLQMMDRHNEMVKKSQELNKEKEKQRALERRNQEHREDQRALLAEMALRNAERRDLIETARLDTTQSSHARAAAPRG